MSRLACLLTLLLLVAAGIARADQPIRVGWYAGEPHQYLSQGELTGADIEMVRAIAARAGHQLHFTAMAYQPLLEEVAAGRMDLVTGLAFTAERAERFALSGAYRQDINVLIVRRGAARRLRFTDGAGLAAHLASGAGFRLGVRPGFSYVDPALDAFIANPPDPALVRGALDNATQIRRLIAGEIDGFVAERLSAARAITAAGAGEAVEEHPMRIAVPLHLGFSRATTPPDTVAAFDAAIRALAAEGVLERINARFRFPLLLSMTMDSRWFLALQITGAVASALAGTLAARQSNWTLFGAFVLAAITAASGGVLRDVIMGRFPIGIARNPLFLQLILGTVVTIWAVLHVWALLRGRAILAYWIAQVAVATRRRRVDRWLFDFADALGLGASTVLGVAVAFGMRAEPFWLWGPLLGTITGAGGGIIRDILRGGGNIPNLKTGFYGEVALIWSLALTAYLMVRGAAIEIDEVVAVVIVVVIGCVATRMAALAFGWKPPRLG